MDYVHVATDDSGSSARMPGAVSSRFPREAPKWRCGEQRLLLRGSFNMKEIDATAIMSRYDVNRNSMIDRAELQQLMRDVSGDKPRDEELAFIARVVDKHSNQGLSFPEVFVGLRALFALHHLPESVGLTMSKYNIGNGPVRTEDLRKCLLALNEQQPVTGEEVNHVRRNALRFEGSEEHASSESVRQAIAIWYLHIERGSTDQGSLLEKSTKNAHERMVARGRLRQLLAGDCSIRDGGAVAFAVIFSLFLVVLPCFEIAMASWFPTTLDCEHPHLSLLLRSNGVLGLLLAASLGSALLAARFQLGAPTRTFLWGFVGTLVSFIVLCTGLGASNVLWSTAARCGPPLWHFAHLVWIEVPLLLLSLVCCGLPILYLCMGSSEIVKNRELDDSLMRHAIL